MNYSSTYIAVIVNILSVTLPKIGVEIGSENLTTTIQTLIALVSGVWVMIQRYRLGGITAFGSRK